MKRTSSLRISPLLLIGALTLSFFSWGSAASAATLVSGRFFYADTNAAPADKVGLTTGAASGHNFTSDAKGIAGVKLDFDSLSGGADAGQFALRYGNTDQTGGWATISDFAVAVDGDSVTLTWDSPTVANAWVKVTYLTDQHIYFGNLVGDANLDRALTPMDALIVINHINSGAAYDDVVDINADDALDINADGVVSPIDALIIINRLNSVDTDVFITGGPFTEENAPQPSPPPREQTFSYAIAEVDGVPTLTASPLPPSLPPLSPNGLIWQTEDVDAPKTFSTGRTAVGVDAAGFAHIAYGGDRLYYAYESDDGWQYETADAAPEVGTHLSMTLDGAGHAHVSYFDERNEDLKYATNASGTWTATTVDSAGRVGEYSAIAVDGTGAVHISYYYNDLPTLKYATNAGGSWSTRNVHVSSSIGTFASGNIGWYSDIAVTGDGIVHISYVGQEKGKLFYATNAYGVFVPMAIADLWPSSDNTGLTFFGQPVQTAIGVDPGQKIHIAYGYSTSVPSTSVILKHITNESGTWVSEVVDDTVSDVGWYADLAIDSVGGLHLSYATGYTVDPEDRYNLRYATNVSGVWALTTVDDASQDGAFVDTEVGRCSAITVGALGAVHISYLNTTHYPFSGCPQNGPNACLEIDMRDRLWYAKNAGSGWAFTEIDKTGRVGDTPALAVGPDGIVHLVYHEELVDTLKYAAGIAGKWTVETAGDTGYAATADGNRAGAIATDPDGAVHIAFSNLRAYDGDGSLVGSELLYTHRPPAAGWQVARILATQAMAPYRGHVPSLAVDTSGKIHTSFSSGAAILYANSAGDWAPMSVSQDQSVGIYSDIAVDAQDRPHVVYVSSSGTLYHRVLDADVWSSADLVDTNVSINQRPNIVVDAGGVIHVTYATAAGLTYASNDGADWSIQELAGGVGDLAVGHDGTTLHLCYSSGSDLYYMTNSGGDFVADLVAADVSAGNDCAIAADAWGRIHIGYFNRTLYDLKYARALAGAPNLGVDPIAHDFGAVDALGTVRKSFSIVNHGDAVLEITDIRIDDQGPIKHYALDRDGGDRPCGGGAVLLLPAENCTVAVDFTPKGIGPLGAILNIDSNDPGKPALGIEMAGSGKLLIGTPAIGASPGGHDFGSIVVGKTSPPLEIRLHNLGGESLDITSMSIDYPPLNYALNLDGSDPCAAVPFTLSAAEACTVTVTFHPAVAGPIADAVEIGSNDPANPLLSIPLEGTGSPPLVVSALSASPTALDFGATNVGGQSTQQTVAIENITGNDVTLSYLVTEPNQHPLIYDIDHQAGAAPCGSPPVVLYSGQICTIGVTFNPIAAGINNTLLRVLAADPNDPGAQVALSGAGVSTSTPPHVTVSPAAWSYKEVIYRLIVGNPSDTVPIDIHNTGGEDLTVTGTVLSDDHNFVIDNSPASAQTPCGPPPFAIAPGRRCTVEAGFFPKSADGFSSTVSIYSTDPDNSVVTVGLEGIALLQGDMDRNHEVTLADLLLLLKVLSGAPADGKALGLSIDGDAALGFPEAIFILQELSGVNRP